MDLLNVLTLYMALVYSSSMQAAPADIQYSPEPTQYVVSTAEPVETVIVTPTITPNYTPGPSPVPKPEFTANPDYKQIKFKDKGDDVRALQTALQNYGYYNGEIDGAYGYQTLEAVRIFQKLHSLSADGIAGRETLTVLYESDNILKLEPTITVSPDPALNENTEINNTVVPIFLNQDIAPIPTEETGNNNSTNIETPFVIDVEDKMTTFDYAYDYSVMLEDGTILANSDTKPLLFANNTNKDVWISLKIALGIVDESFSEVFSFVYDSNVYNDSEDNLSLPNTFELSTDRNGKTILVNIINVGNDYYVNIDNLSQLFDIEAQVNESDKVCVLSLKNN